MSCLRLFQASTAASGVVSYYAKEAEAMRAMKLYIAGPMTGYTNRNEDAFRKTEMVLKAMGHAPLVPADIPPYGRVTVIEGSPVSWAANLRADLIEMLQCDGVVLLSGWMWSHGARLEHQVATACGVMLYKVRYPLHASVVGPWLEECQ